jgi:hypothetical protein
MHSLEATVDCAHARESPFDHRIGGPQDWIRLSGTRAMDRCPCGVQVELQFHARCLHGLNPTLNEF